jgi:hypothetical protein
VELFTARYVDYDPAWGVAVRTTVGAPKGWRHWPLEHIRRVTPYGLLHIRNREEFAERYIARLERAGAEVIERRLQGIADKYAGGSLWLCCFDDLTKPGAWCHRTLLGGWLEENLGVEVIEINKPSQSAQLRLSDTTAFHRGDRREIPHN